MKTEVTLSFLPWDSAEMVLYLASGSSVPTFPYFEGSYKSVIIFCY